jgi:hypothetical protein
MSSGVSLIMAKLDNPGTEPTKPRHSIEACLDYLDREIDAVLQRLPARRRVSFVEVALFCVVRHLPFRQLLDVTRWQRLTDFCEEFEKRDSARYTEYRFDAQ